jgi:hypothetical protein
MSRNINSSPMCNSPGKFIGSPTKRREMDVMKLMVIFIHFNPKDE